MLVTGATGVARYATSLAQALPLIGGRPMVLRDEASPDDRAGRWWSAVRGGARPVSVRGSRSARGDSGPWPEEDLVGRHLFRAAPIHFSLHRRLLPIAARIGPGVMHWTYPVPMRIEGWINIYTIHDMIPLDHPRWSAVDGRRLSAILARILASADRIVTVSESARASILARLRCDPALVVNCYQPIPAVADKHSHPDPVLPAGLKHDAYFLFCGSNEPRKNVVRLIEAHARSGVRIPLVLVGPDSWPQEATPALSNGRVIPLAYVTKNDLAHLQRYARALLFPSLAEGFGLPVVEAMALGTPVLTSNSGALAEIAGEAALLVDPFNVGAIAVGIARLASDIDLRSKLSALGRDRASAFSMSNFVERLRRVYGEAIARRFGCP